MVALDDAITVADACPDFAAVGAAVAHAHVRAISIAEQRADGRAQHNTVVVAHISAVER